MGNPWAHKIDYDRSIADDEREIAALSDPVAIAVSADLTPEEQSAYFGGGFHWDVADFVLSAWGNPEHAERRLAMLGLSRQDIVDYVHTVESDPISRAEKAPILEGYDFADAVTRGAYARGREIAKRLDGFHWYITTPEKRAERIKKAKANLARHKRNQAKFGR